MTSVRRGIFPLLAVWICFGGRAACAERGVAPWTYRADFQHGFAGWMSFPLPQDIGFDPTLNVENTDSGWALIREVSGDGKKRLTMGVRRPIHFIARAETAVRLGYRTEWATVSAHLRLVLTGEDGRRYAAEVPAAAAAHDVSVTGRQLGIAGGDVAVAAVALEGAVEGPQTGVANRIVLRKFEAVSFRVAEVAVIAPALEAENGDHDTRVASLPLWRGEPLEIELGAHAAVKLKVTDPEGHTAFETNLAAAKGTREVVKLGSGPAGLWTAEVGGDGARTRFSFVMLEKAAPHPRTLLSADRLRELKTGGASTAVREQVHAQAHSPAARVEGNRSAGDNILRMLKGRSLKAGYDGELTPYFQLVDSYANAIAACALDFVLNGDRGSLEAAKRDLLAVAQWSTWTPPRFASHGMHTYYEAGLLAQKAAFGYDLIAAELTQAEKETVARGFRQNVIEPTVEEYFRFNRMPLAASNWMANSVGGALMAAAVTEGDVAGWREHEGAALARLTAAYGENLRALFRGDGAEMEPIGYQHFAMEGFSWGAAALEALKVRPPELQRMFESFRWPKYAMVRADLMLDGGDFDEGLKSFDGFAYAAENGENAELREFYGRRPKRDASVLDLICCTREAQAGVEAPRSQVFAERGSAVLRSGWDGDATVISLRAGPWFNHEHHDQGSFQAAAFGDAVIGEAGYTNYYRDPNYASYFTQAPGHNTVLVDEDAFSQADSAGVWEKGGGEHRARMTAHLFAPQMDYVEADLKGAYDGRLTGYTRRYLFLSPDVLMVSDEVSAAEAHAFTWLLHPAAGATAVVSGDRVRIATRSAEAEVVTAEGPESWELQTAPLPIALLQNFDRGKIADRYVLRLAAERAREARFTVGLRFGKRGAGDGSEMKPLTTKGAAGFEGRRWAAWFRSGSEPLRVGDYATDAKVFARRDSDGTSDWLAAWTTSVSRGNQRLITASTNLLAAYTETAREIQIGLTAAGDATVEISIPRDASALFVDGAPAAFEGDKAAVERLSKGEHHVRILAGKSL